jgi:hypothetical protein
LNIFYSYFDGLIGASFVAASFTLKRGMLWFGTSFNTATALFQNDHRATPSTSDTGYQ